MSMDTKSIFQKELLKKQVDMRRISLKQLVALSTARNRLLITAEEQQKLSHSVVGFFGLSVGSHAASTWAMLARPAIIKIADPDFVDGTNLNRIRVGWSAVGKMKVDILSALLSDMHPAMRIETLIHTDPTSMDLFCRLRPRLSIIVDEIDDISGKITLRKLAKRLKIPLISAVDVGENVLIDVERYDRTPAPKMFLGRVPNIQTIDVTSLTKQEKARLIIALVGLEYNSIAMLQSLLEIGKSIETWPQLGSTATMAGGIIATVLKKIVLGERVESGRYVVNMDEILHHTYDKAQRQAHAVLIRKVKERYHISRD